MDAVTNCLLLMFNSLQTIFLFYVLASCSLYILLTLRIITPQKKRIPTQCKVLLITAHPDDECLFFAPAVIELSLTNSVHILCVTSGDYYGKGAIRKNEILESCQILGVPKENIEVFDNSSFPDDPRVPWDFKKLHHHLGAHIDALQPDYILTFDERGVSGHPNHIAASQALKQMLKENGPSQFPKLYHLESVSLVRKYISFLDLPLSFMANRLTFVSSFSNIVRSLHAMYAHHTQFVWFRVLYVIFSRYMIMNTFVPVES